MAKPKFFRTLILCGKCGEKVDTFNFAVARGFHKFHSCKEQPPEKEGKMRNKMKLKGYLYAKLLSVQVDTVSPDVILRWLVDFEEHEEEQPPQTAERK